MPESKMCPILFHGWLASARETDPAYDLTCKEEGCALWDEEQKRCMLGMRLTEISGGTFKEKS